MALITDYTTGTVTVAPGGTTVTGTGTAWKSAGIRAGDTIMAQGLVVAVTEDASSETSLTIDPWPGAALADAAYRLRYQPDASRLTATARDLLVAFANGNLASIADLASAADKLPYFTGAGTADLASFPAAARSLFALTAAADKLPYFTADDAAAVTNLSAFARTLLDDADAAAALATLGVSDFAKTLIDDADADTARATLGVGQVAGFRNKIINGAFDVWQRGAGAFTATGYTADRWFLSNGAGASNSIRRALAATPYPDAARYVLSWTRSAAGTSASQLIQKMEDVITFSGKRVTLTFWAAADAPTEIEVYFAQLFGTGGSPSATVNGAPETFSLTGQPTKFTATFDIPTIDGKALGTNGDDCLWLLLRRLHNTQNPTALVNITIVSVVEGDATAETDPFSPRHPQQERALCQRYFTTGSVYGWGYSPNIGNNRIAAERFKQTMRANPSVSWSAVVYGNVDSHTLEGLSENGFGAFANVVAPGNYTMNANYSADAEL